MASFASGGELSTFLLILVQTIYQRYGVRELLSAQQQKAATGKDANGSIILFSFYSVFRKSKEKTAIVTTSHDKQNHKIQHNIEKHQSIKSDKAF